MKSAITLSTLIFLIVTFILNNNTNGQDVTSIAVSGTNFFVGTKNGVFFVTDNGNKWVKTDSKLDKDEICNIVACDSIIIAGTLKNGVFASNNNGISWNSANKGILHYGIPPEICSIALFQKTIYLGTSGYENGGLYCSNDYGATWIRIDKFSKNSITSIVTDSANIYISTFENGLFKSSDNGKTWKKICNKKLIKKIGVIGSTIYVLYGYTKILVFSNDDGNSWVETNPNTVMASIETQINNFITSGSKMFIGSSKGVYAMTKGDPDWIAFNKGLDGPIYPLAVVGDKIYSGNNTTGVLYASSIYKDEWEKANKGFIDLDAIEEPKRNAVQKELDDKKFKEQAFQDSLKKLYVSNRREKVNEYGLVLIPCPVCFGSGKDNTIEEKTWTTEEKTIHMAGLYHGTVTTTTTGHTTDTNCKLCNGNGMVPKNGLIIQFYSEGQVRKLEWDGYRIEYNRDGKKEVEGGIYNSKKYGEWKEWDYNGKLKRIETYDGKGLLLKTINY